MIRLELALVHSPGVTVRVQRLMRTAKGWERPPIIHSLTSDDPLRGWVEGWSEAYEFYLPPGNPPADLKLSPWSSIRPSRVLILRQNNYVDHKWQEVGSTRFGSPTAQVEHLFTLAPLQLFTVYEADAELDAGQRPGVPGEGK